jgi:uncharacterized membrane protein (DUF4010 family)
MAPDPQTLSIPYNEIAYKVALSTGIGLLVGLEREWAHKEIGVRTFSICCLLGMLTSLLGGDFIIAALVSVVILVAFLNVHSLLHDRSLEMTTSTCLVVVFFLGAFVGRGNYFAAATSAIVMIMLLAWKVELERFADALRPEEIRSAVLLGLLSVVVYPLLPDRFIDPWHLIEPRQYWITVVVIAGIGFLNYVLLRLYSAKGLYYAAVLGGLVNSRAAVIELSAQFRKHHNLADNAFAVLLLTNVAMFVRNAVILGIFDPKAVASAAGPLAVMALATAAVIYMRGKRGDLPAETLNLDSPVSLRRVLYFSALLLGLACAGTLAQQRFGSAGFLVVTLIGGLVSSASTTATTAALAATGQVAPEMAGIAIVLTSITSALVNVPLVYQQSRHRALTRRLAWASVGITCLGLLALALPLLRFARTGRG